MFVIIQSALMGIMHQKMLKYVIIRDSCSLKTKDFLKIGSVISHWDI